MKMQNLMSNGIYKVLLIEYSFLIVIDRKIKKDKEEE